MHGCQKFILLDFDGTLATEPVGGYEGFEEFQKEFDFSDDDIKKAKEYITNNLENYTRDEAVVRSAKDERAHHRSFYKNVVETLVIDQTKRGELTEKIIHRRMNELVFHEAEGAREALDDLQKIGYMRILFSNAFLSRKELIKRMGLAEYFEDIVLSAEAGVSKPDKGMYEFAFSKQNLDPSNGWIVDNEIVNVKTMIQLGGRGAVSALDHREGVIVKDNIPHISSIKELSVLL